jgi:hypothetical protein
MTILVFLFLNVFVEAFKIQGGIRCPHKSCHILAQREPQADAIVDYKGR